MVKRNVLQKKLRKLDEYLGILRTLQRYSFAEFSEDPERYGSVERFLHLTIESLTDLGSHAIADENLGEVNWYSDIPTILADKGFITPEQREMWIKMIGFRNVLVHRYGDIDRRIVYDVLQNRLQDFAELRQVFAPFL